MDCSDDWFPYETYRPHQREMLNLAEDAARNHDICMIDAPTGSGKSSVLSALLSAANGRKIIVAVRTVSQLNTFIRELELIKRKKGHLKVAYLVGKRRMCMMGADGDIYRMCEGLKAFSTSLMRERAHRGSLIPANDPVLKTQIRRQDAEHPLLCPYFIKSKIYIEGSDGLKMVPSNTLKVKAEQVSKRIVPPEKIHEVCNEICPYEVMLQAARDADVILMNFYHIFDETIRDQMYQSISVEPENTILLIDEAHNCGDTVQSIQTVTLSEQSLEMAQNELSHMRGRVGGVEAVLNLIPQVQNFMSSLKRSVKQEDWFDPLIFTKYILNGTLYQKTDEISDDLLRINETINEAKLEKGDFKESPVENLTSFFTRILQSAGDDSFLTIYKKNLMDISLEVRNIDPSKTLSEIAKMHSASILISGTLSPVESYKKLYFGDMNIKTLSLPNAFPKENRLIFCANDITSAFSLRRDPENTKRILDYINSFAAIKGNLAVYFPSYDMLKMFTKDLPKKLKRKDVFIESQDSSQANSDLRVFMSLPEVGRSGIIFGVCGGKWSEGLDYRGEMLNGAVVIGLPLAPYNDVRRMINDYFKNKFGKEGEFLSYTLPAINKATQALGRVLRTPEDRGVLLIGESRFLDKSVKKGLPHWMQEELAECNIDEFRSGIAGWN
ncbi:DNA excision repair protein ERCC-2 [Methanomicrobium sp. W14]|uniref:ATP-dependent DNA helicase n=1 Tax=Methanomicrobium sp. W14 TaxID=2817839 RepID=UPI001AEA1DDE|nr:ATP-dependent DNA helicase [Methanomicrobium sp. W14]MBP2132927.1 DNA excision repair protein ERCC-2 [Methanomicrobium sp. W14]